MEQGLPMKKSFLSNPKVKIWVNKLQFDNIQMKFLEQLFMNPDKTAQTFRNATTGSPLKWHLRNKHRNSILMTCYYPDLGSTSDWLKICFNQSETLTSSPSDAS